MLIIGAGGLGSPAALYLAAAGVGHLGIVDRDVVDASNLQRQILHDTRAIGERKTRSAERRLRDLNPRIELETFDTDLSRANALEILRGYDVVVDGSDNFRTRYLTNDAAVLLRKPNVYGSVQRFEGQASVFGTAGGPCYRCLYPEPPSPGQVPSCEEAGVFGVLPGLIGTIQATEAIKLILGLGETLAGRLLLFDALGMQFRTVHLRRDPHCPACGTRELRELPEYDELCDPTDLISAGHRDDNRPTIGELSPKELVARLQRGDDLSLIDVRESWEWSIAHIAGAQLMPLSTLPSEARGLDRRREVVVYCHHGPRGVMAAHHLSQLGVKRVWNLQGGIARWRLEVDPTLPEY